MFEASDPPRTSTVRIDGAALPMLRALPLLLRADPPVEPWSAVARFALELVAQGRILPGVSPGGFDAWRAGPLDPEDVERIRALGPEEQTRQFLDAVADTLPRTPAAELAAGGPEYAAATPQHVPHLKPWADERAAGLDAGVRISLRIEADDDARDFHAVLQLHSLTNPALVTDAAMAEPGALVDAALAVRRAAQVWPPLGRLLHDAVPDRLELADDEVTELLAGAAARLVAAGVDVHWPKELLGRVTARAAISARDEQPGLFGGDTLLDVDWQLALGDSPLTKAELDQLAEANRPVVRLREQWLLVDPDVLDKARERRLAPLTPIDALGAALTGTAEVDGEQVEVAPSGWLDGLQERLEPERIEQPDQLAGTLRDYQLAGCGGWRG